MANRQHCTARAAFTLIEILVVIAIIGILAGTVSVYIPRHLERAKINTARNEIASIGIVIQEYLVDNDRYPADWNALVGGDEPYIVEGEVPIDPWGRPYYYRFPGTHRPHPYDLLSVGSDGIASDDDIGNWNLKKKRP